MVKTGQAWTGTFVTLDASGALATPSVGPAGVLYVDGTANGASVTISGSNPYKFSVTLPALTAGQTVSMYVTATVATIATAAVVAEEIADTKRVSDLADLDAAGTRAALGMAAADLDTQLDAILEDTGTTLPAQITDIQGRIPAALVGGRIDANAGAISGDATAADNLEAVLDGTGGVEIKIKKLTINNPDALGVGIQVNAYNGAHIGGTNRGVTLEGGENMALYMFSNTAAATMYIEGPATGGRGIAISSPSDGTSQPNAAGIYIQTEAGHPGIIFDFTDPADVLKIINSDNGNWVWDDTIGQLDDGAITAAKFDLSTAFPLTQADAGSTAIARTGADSDTLETLSDQIDGVGAGSSLTAQQTRDAMKLAPSAGAPAAGSVDAHLDAIQAQTDTIDDIKAVTDALDISAVTHVTVNDAGVLTITRTLSFSTTLSGLDIPADWEACYWTVKRSTDDPDAEALIQMLESNPGDAEDGVQVLMGTAQEDGSDGSLVVNQVAGTVAIVLGDASTALLEDAVELVWDVKFHFPAGKTQPGTGTATITTAVTRA